MDKYYAGIGSQKTPDHILKIMSHIGSYLGTQGYTLRSGGSKGADEAFEKGAIRTNGDTEIYLPWRGFNNHLSDLNPSIYPFSDVEYDYAEQNHPAWRRCSPSARLMHQRNVRIMVGHPDLHGEIVKPSKFIVCWTAHGALEGGTAQALRIAQRIGTPVINLGEAISTDQLELLVLKVDELIKE